MKLKIGDIVCVKHSPTSFDPTEDSIYIGAIGEVRTIGPYCVVVRHTDMYPGPAKTIELYYFPEELIRLGSVKGGV